MSSFESTRGQFNQEHFEVVEIDLPVITGACTVSGEPGFGTPLFCDQAWTNEYKTYKFTNNNAPVLAGNFHRYIKNIKETPTEIKPGKGLSSRGSVSVTFTDFVGDPNIGAPAVTSQVIEQGTFFGKLSARQILINKELRVKLYRVESDGTIDLAGGALTKTYLIQSFKNNSNGSWTVMCKDQLSVANIDEKSWPISLDGFVRLDVTDIATVIPVDGNTDYSSAEIVRIGDEYIPVNSVTDNLLPTAALNVSRDFEIFAPVSGVLLTKSIKDSHTAGDEVFICRISDDETIDSLLFDVLTESDVPASIIPVADWADEVSQWQANTKINYIWGATQEVNRVLGFILESYLMDMWFEPEDSEIKLSAISVWKESTNLLTEGNEINANTIKTQPRDAMRATRALVVYNKGFLARSDDVENYSKASQFSAPELISEDLFGKHKDKQFKSNSLIDDTAAILLTQRYVSRFKFTPFEFSWITEERKLNFSTGDVVDISTTEAQGASGLPSGNERAQILSIKTNYKKDGRVYNVKAITYEPAFEDNTEIVITSPLGSVNLYLFAGAPSTAVTITFVLDGSYSFGSTAIRAGSFPSGSKIILILANAFDGQANGGAGGRGESILFEEEFNQWFQVSPATIGSDGGTVYNAEGVDTDIYFSGATPSANFPTADGFIRAPGAGGDGKTSNQVGTSNSTGWGGNGGGGGAGRNVGLSGMGGTASEGGTPINGINGATGDIIGNGGIGGVQAPNPSGEDGADWGQDTSSALAGNGVIDSGATVVFFGDTPARYINGNGDH